MHPDEEEAQREEAELNALFRVLDDPPPAVSAEALALRAVMDKAAARTRGSGWMRRAAAVLLVVGVAGAAYAIPGSPVRGWVQDFTRKLSGGGGSSGGGVPDTGGHTPGVSGVAVVPGQRLVILFQRWQPGSSARVVLDDGPEVRVQAAAGAATFTSNSDLLVIDNGGSPAVFEIRIPRTAPLVEILVGGDRVFLKEGPGITTGATASAAGVYLVPLTSSGRR